MAARYPSPSAGCDQATALARAGEGGVCAGPGGSGRLCGHGGARRDIHCLKRPARSGSRRRSPGSARATSSCPPRRRRTTASRGAARRLPHLPGQPALRRPGRLHPPPDPRARRPRPLGRGLRRAALARARRGVGFTPGPRPGPLPPPGPVPRPAPARVHLTRGLDRVRHHVHGRLRRAAGLLAAGPPAAGAAPRRVRRGARQPVPGHRHAGHGRGRVAAAHDAAPSRSPSTASSPCRTRRTPGSASPPAAGSASSACRCGSPGRSRPW